MDERCPRCGGGFHCGVNEGHCACFGLQLTEALKSRLAAQYPGQCLCVPCLAALAARPEAGDAAPERPKAGTPPSLPR